MEEGLDFSVKYPFSDSAKAAIADATLTERIVELAVERVLKALNGEAAPRLVLSDNERRQEIASFAAARMMLGHLRNSFLTSRFAVNESKIVHHHLDKEPREVVDRVAESFGIRTAGEGDGLSIDLPTYLKYSLRNPHYKLINRKMSAGRVEITAHEKKRLVEEAVRKHIEDIPFVKDPPQLLKDATKKLVEALPKVAEAKITAKAGDHPPCVDRLLGEMKRHQNLPHHARWFLASYLLAIGTDEEGITRMFSVLPDFNERVTRYQVSHIRGKGYSVPSCATVMSYGLCCAVCRIGSPINWHTLDEGRKKGIRGSGPE